MLEPCWLQRHWSVASLACREASFYHLPASLELDTLPNPFSSLRARPIYRHQHLLPPFQQKAARGTKYTAISFCSNNHQLFTMANIAQGCLLKCEHTVWNELLSWEARVSLFEWWGAVNEWAQQVKNAKWYMMVKPLQGNSKPLVFYSH